MGHEPEVPYHEFLALKQDITDMKSLMSRMVEVLSRISVIEERQNQFSSTATEALKRMEEIAQRQHQHEVNNAANSTVANRVDALEVAARESYVEAERNKARFQTFTWIMRTLWVVVIAGAASFAWLIDKIPAHIRAEQPAVASTAQPPVQGIRK